MRSYLATIPLALACCFVSYGQTDRETLDLYSRKGANLIMSFQIDSGTFYLNKAIEGHRANQDWEKFFQSQYYLCVSYFLKTRDVELAEDSLNSNLDLAKTKMGEAGSGVGEMYFGLGWLNDNARRDRQTATEYYYKALETWEGFYGRNHEKTGKAYANYILSLINTQQLAKAEEYLLKALDIYEEIYPPYHTEWGRLYNSAFYYYNGLRQLEKASTYANAMYQLATNNDAARRWYTRACRNLSMTYYNLQEYDLAAQYAIEELDAGKDILNENQIAEIYNNLGRIYLFSDGDKAIDFTAKAWELKKSALGSDHPSTVSSAINYASAQADLGEPAKAVKAFVELIDLEATKASSENELRTWNLLAKAYYLNRQWSECVETFEATENLYTKVTNGNTAPDLLFNFYVNAATSAISSLVAQFNETGEVESLEQGNELFERVDLLMSENWNNLEYNSDQQSFLNLNTEFYIAAADLFFYLFESTGEISYADRFLYTSEKSKASISFPAFVLALKKDQIKVPGEILDFKKNLEIEIAQLENDQEQEASILVSKKSSRDSLIAIIKSEYPSYYSERIADLQISANEIQTRLDEDEATIIYMTNVTNYAQPESVVISLLITKDKLKMLRGSSIELSSKVQTFINGVKSRADVDQESRELYQILGLSSMENEIAGQKIAIVPNNELFSLPFELLKNEQGISMIEGYNIRYYPSASMMLSKRESGKVQAASLFAPELSPEDQLVASASREKKNLVPLYSSIKEVSQIGEIIGGENINTLSKASMLKKMSQADIIHLATHAEVSHSSPGSSELYLSNDRDSSIYAYELYNQNFKAQLVTLSACNTGVGKLQKGEGIQSLAKAFTFAGCQNIVMSLWPVNDESTAELMTQFYKNLKSGMRKDEALREAKLSYVRNADPVKAHPYYWAGFVFSGNPEPLEFESKWFGNWLWLAVLIFIIIGFLRRKKNQS